MTAAATSPTLTVMTYNVGNGLAPPDRLAAYLRATGADLVGLQELAAGQAVALERGLAEAYPHRVLAGHGFSGRALLSRYPIVEREWLDLSPGRLDLRAVVDEGGQLVTVVVAHPPPPRPSRRGVLFDGGTLAQIARPGIAAVGGAPAVSWATST